MNEWLLRSLGVRADQAGTVVAMDFEIHPAVSWTVVLVLAGIALGAATVGYLRRDVDLTPARRRLLLGLRMLVLVTIGGVLLRPELGLRVEGLVRQGLVLLFDRSASIGLRDPRNEIADQVRAAIVEGRLPASGGLDQRPPAVIEPRRSRLELLQAAITNRELALVERLGRDFDLRAIGFAGGLMALPEPESTASTNRTAGSRGLVSATLAASLLADGRQTAPGTALREVLDRERGRPLGGVVLFTDGIRNAGSDPRDAVDLARDAGVTVHVVALGTTQPRDLQVVEIAAPEVAFVRDEVPIAVRLQARGLAGQTVRLSLSIDGNRVDERDTTLAADGESQVNLKFTPEQTGDFELAADVPARPDEILAENNRQARRLRVIDDRIRVLLLEQSPRWEFRYLQALLLRDRRVALKCVLFDGDPAIARNPGSPYLDAFPGRREELFAYDLIVFGDVDPRNFTPSQFEVLADFVAQSGGSFLMVAGRRFSPWSYRDTPLERLLPVEFDRLRTDLSSTAVYDRPIKLRLTAEGRRSPLLRLSEDPEENLQRWQALPPLYWVAPVGRAKPAAQVLVADEGREESGEPAPVIAMQQYGVGQSMFVGTDNTWRWRRNEGEQFFVSFWGRVVQRLAIHHLLSGSRRTQLTLDRVSAVPGERVAVSARLFSSAFEPLAEAAVAAQVERVRAEGEADAAATELTLRAVPDQPGVFHGEFVAPASGRYRIRVGEDAPAAVDFTVEDRWVEEGETALQEGTWRDLVALSGGGFFREEDLHRLPETVRSMAERVESRLSIELWSSPLYYLAILGLLTGEWVLRKWWHLK